MIFSCRVSVKEGGEGNTFLQMPFCASCAHGKNPAPTPNLGLPLPTKTCLCPQILCRLCPRKYKPCPYPWFGVAFAHKNLPLPTEKTLPLPLIWGFLCPQKPAPAHKFGASCAHRKNPAPTGLILFLITDRYWNLIFLKFFSDIQIYNGIICNKKTF